MAKNKMHTHRHYEEENEWGCGSWLEYALVMVLACILLLASLGLTLYWVIRHQEGFAWRDDPKRQFNLHPVLMVAGFITFSGFCEYRNCVIRFLRGARSPFTNRSSASKKGDQVDHSWISLPLDGIHHA
jgi:hypothetical protein